MLGFFNSVLHWKLTGMLNKHIEYCFTGGNGGFVILDRYGAQWGNRLKTGPILFTINFLKKAMKYSLDHCHFKLSNKIFRSWIKKAKTSDIS